MKLAKIESGYAERNHFIASQPPRDITRSST